MSWNYRINKESYTEPNGEKQVWFSVIEVYYTEEGKINGWTAPRTLEADSPEDIEDILAKIKEALQKPFLNLTLRREE